MKKITLILIPAIAALISCKKFDTVVVSSGAVNVTNAVVGGAKLTLSNTTQTVGNNNFAWFPLAAGQTQVNLVDAAVTPAVAYFNQVLTVDNSDKYSLFLAGASPTSVDVVLVKDTYQNYTDSLCGVRFINLSPNSGSISVNLSGQANGSEVNSLAYKAYGSFKQYPAKSANASYAFQIKDAVTGNLIASYSLTTPRFHNVTIALRGLVGGAPAVGVTLVNDY